MHISNHVIWKDHNWQGLYEASPFTWTESQLSTYGIMLRDENMDVRTLSVTARKLWIDDSNLLTTSVCVNACSVVTSYGNLL